MESTKDNVILILKIAGLLLAVLIAHYLKESIGVNNISDESLKPSYWAGLIGKTDYMVIEMDNGKTHLSGKSIAEWLKNTTFKVDENQHSNSVASDFDIYIDDVETSPVLYSFLFNDGAPRVMVKTESGFKYHSFPKSQYTKLYIQIMSSSYYEPN